LFVTIISCGNKINNCSVKTENFIRLWLDVGSLAGAQCQLIEEDDISISSSIEDDEDKHDEDDEDKDEDEDCDKGDTEESKEQQDSTNADDDENDDIVDLTKSPQRPEPQPSKTADNDSNNGNVDDDDPQRGQNKLRRLSRIAKKFKKQYLQKSSQYKEQYAEKRKLSNRVRQAEGELKRIQEEMSKCERDRELYELNLNESRLDLIRIRFDRDTLRSRHSTMAVEKTRAEALLLECRSHYEKELENARAKSMSEVQEIMEEHPKVVEENRVLKQKLHKLNRSLSRGGSNNSHGSSNKTIETTSSISSRSHSKAKDLSKELRELDELIRFRPNTAPSKTSVAAGRKSSNTILAGSGVENRSHQPRRQSIFDSARNHDSSRKNSSSSHTRGASASASIKVNSGQYSGFASRMMKASQKATKRPPLQGADASGGKKRSSAIAALSLTSQTKRMKSYSASRRDLFQRKP
jgi:hypothetical protein